MAPKPSTGGSSFPVAGSSYQGGGANYNYDELTSTHEYSKMYSGSKPSNPSKNSSAEMSSLGGSYKQPPHFDKTAAAAGSYQQQQSFGLQNQQQYLSYMQPVNSLVIIL